MQRRCWRFLRRWAWASASSPIAGGAIRDVIMRITDVFLAFSTILLLLVPSCCCTTASEPPSLRTPSPRVRYRLRAVSVATSIRHRGYIDAARCVNIRMRRVICRRILPNSLTPALAQLPLDDSNCRHRILHDQRRTGGCWCHHPERTGSTVRRASRIVHVVGKLGDRIHERLVLVRVPARGVRKRLAVAFLVEAGGAGVRHPDL